MRGFAVATPVQAGVVEVDDVPGDDVVPIDLTEDDARDLNQGLSITTLTTTGEEVAVFPGT